MNPSNQSNPKLVVTDMLDLNVIRVNGKTFVRERTHYKLCEALKWSEDRWHKMLEEHGDMIEMYRDLIKSYKNVLNAMNQRIHYLESKL